MRVRVSDQSHAAAPTDRAALSLLTAWPKPPRLRVAREQTVITGPDIGATKNVAGNFVRQRATVGCDEVCIAGFVVRDAQQMPRSAKQVERITFV
jgi:hypothetical protein